MLVDNNPNINLNTSSTNQNGELVASLTANYNNDPGIIITVEIYKDDPVLNQDFIDFKDLALERKDEMMERIIALRYTEN